MPDSISHHAILESGYRDLDFTDVDQEKVRELYRFMVRLRRCEEYHPTDEMRRPVHFCIGQEAVPAAMSALLIPKDYLLSHH